MGTGHRQTATCQWQDEGDDIDEENEGQAKEAEKRTGQQRRKNARSGLAERLDAMSACILFFGQHDADRRREGRPLESLKRSGNSAGDEKVSYLQIGLLTK